jgi:hypothetical protein
MELSLPSHAIARVDRTEFLRGPQGYAVTVVFDNGIVNMFDEADPGPRWPFSRTDPCNGVTLSRITFLMSNSPADYPAEEMLRDIAYILTGERA